MGQFNAFVASATVTVLEFLKDRKLKSISFKLTVRAYDIENKRPVEIVLKDFSKYSAIHD